MHVRSLPVFYPGDERRQLPTYAATKEKPQQWGWGGLRLGLLIFEIKTHPVTVDTMIGRRLRFL
jgi:hypothetical protein